MADDIREDLDKLLMHGEQIWLLGAGASCDANLPLVVGLTARVRSECAAQEIPREGQPNLKIGVVWDGLLSSLHPDATIETILDHLADHFSVAKRAANKAVTVGDGAAAIAVSASELKRVRDAALVAIREALRWGYCHDPDPKKCRQGKPGESIVDISSHLDLMDVLFDQMQAGRAARLKPVDFFTVNYDTLLEDALALRGLSYCDGFAGGAVGYWDPGETFKSTARATLTKLHGSIDWAYIPDNERIVRRRIGDKYPETAAEVLIYPQASKYDFARREPFDTLFQRFRDSINRTTAQVLIVCGYSFGDDHVDVAIEQALSRQNGGGLTLIAFSKTRNDKLKRWAQQQFGERVYVVAEDGIWRGREGPFEPPAPGATHNWWTFRGMTKLLREVRA